MTESPGTRSSWTPARWPADEVAAKALRDWLAGPPGEDFYGIELDFSGADLSGGDFTEAWFSKSRLLGATLRNCSLVRAHVEEADFSDADLSGADLTKVSGRGSVFRDARLRGTDLKAAELNRADFTGADLTGANLGDALLTRSTLARANLTDATADKAVLRNTILDSAQVRGLTGTVIGPISVIFRGQRALLDGPDLEQWFNTRGARITRFHADKDAS